MALDMLAIKNEERQLSSVGHKLACATFPGRSKWPSPRVWRLKLVPYEVYAFSDVHREDP
jgi:hypothetical protein